MKGRLYEAAPYAALLVGAAFLYHDAGTFSDLGRPGQLGPDFWPRAVLALLMLVCACEIVRRLVFERVERDAAPAPHAAEHADATDAEARYPWRLAAGIGLTIAYVLALDWLGFFVATALYLALFMIAGRYARMRVIAITSLAGSLAFVFVFMKIVYVSLPLGSGPFRAFSTWILAMLGIR
jgi:putative tricarboxylic transport membrane protein